MTAGGAREKSILLVVEGKRREPLLMGSLLSRLGIADDYRIVSFETVIYQLFEYLGSYGDVGDVDLVNALRELFDKDPEKRGLLDCDFTDVVLVFDFDPQDNRCNLDILHRYQEAFCDSTDNGLLFVNYPSVEAYRDFETLGDPGFVDEHVSVMGDVGCASYKDRVSRRNNGLDDIDKINALQWAQIIAMHASKAQHLLGGARAEDCAYWAPSEDLARAALDIDLLAMHDHEVRGVARGYVFPVCTCVFFACTWPGRVNGAWKKARRL